MQISKENINLIPEMAYIKFEQLEGQTRITAWDNAQLVAQLCIPNEINKTCIVRKKTIQMMRALCKNQPQVDVNVTSTFNVSSTNGKYRGGIVTPEFDMNVSFDETKMNIYKYDSSILLRAAKFTSPNAKGILQGVNVGEAGVAATDSYKAYCYGTPNDGIPSITLDLKFIEKISKYGFSEIYSNKNQVMIVDSLGINWYSTILDGEYPRISKVFQSSIESLEFNFETLHDAIDLAIESHTEIKDDPKDIRGYVDFLSDGKEITIETENYQNIFKIESRNFRFRLAAVPLKLLNTLEVKDIYYSASNRPIIVKIGENEKALFLPIIGVDEK